MYEQLEFNLGNPADWIRLPPILTLGEFLAKVAEEYDLGTPEQQARRARLDYE